MKLFLLNTTSGDYYVVAETPNDADAALKKHLVEITFEDDYELDVITFTKAGTDEWSGGDDLGITIFNAVKKP